MVGSSELCEGHGGERSGIAHTLGPGRGYQKPPGLPPGEVLGVGVGAILS